MQIRELTGTEKRDIRRLVRAACANYDSEYGCLLLDGMCFMFGKAYTLGALCKWFRAALLPLEPGLSIVLIGGIKPDTKPCKLCGKPFPLNRRQAYCSETCAKIGRRNAVSGNVRAYRSRKRQSVIN